MQRDRENLRQLIRDMGFGSLETDLMSYARPSIRVHTQIVEDERAIPIGNSKIGGRPDLPRDLEWVTVINNDARVSLPFIAQFDMKDVKPHDQEGLLPESGILYFFADPWRGVKYSDHGRVIFFDGDKSHLERKDFPDDIAVTSPHDWGERYSPCSVTFVPEVNLPSEYGEELEFPEGKIWIDFHNLINAASYTQPHSRIVNRLLGFNYGVPTDLQLNAN